VKREPKLVTVCRLSDFRTKLPTELVTRDNLKALKNLMLAQAMHLERENYPGSWAWRNPK
jgi:hypothetical protein